jgi:beta-glucosidase
MGSRPAKALAYCVGGAALALAAAALAQSPARAQAHPAQWPRLRPAIALNAQLEARISALLARMTAAQKVGQLIQADIGSITPADLLRYPLGAVLNGGNSAPGDDKLATPAAWLALADRFYAASMPAGGLGLPVLWGTDAVHGHNSVVGATIFPQNIGLGATHDPQLIRRIGAVTALEVRVTGLDWTFAPTLAIARDLRWGRSYESYAADPQLVRSYGRALVEGLQGIPGTPQFLDAAHVIATAKHFLGDGATVGGKDEGDAQESERELRDVDAAGYLGALGAGVQSVMASYSSWQGRKMHGNRSLLSGVLKGRFAFDGFVIGDWNGHAQLPGCSPDSCVAAVTAGIDMLMAPEAWRELFEHTLAQVQSGVLPQARLDDAVRRVLRVKLRAGLDREGRPSTRAYAGQFELLGAPEHRALARQAVRESLVLLKNHAHLLPLSPHLRVLVAGDAADSIARQSGGWSVDWQGTEPNEAFPQGQTVFAAIRQCVRAAGGEVTLSAAGAYSARPDVAIVVFGEQPYAEYRGDRATLEFSPGDKPHLALLQRLRAAGVPVVAVFLSGRPLWVNAELNAADSFVAAWLPGPEAGGIADVLFRAADGSTPYDFRGRLPFAWPRTPSPPAVGGALFPAGYGLRYRDAGELPALAEAQPAPR